MTVIDPALLADLDAGVLEPARAEEVRAAALADPRASAVLDALRDTRAELGALPPPALPPAVAHRWFAALAAADSPEPAPPPHPARVHDPDTASSRIGPGALRPRTREPVRPSYRWAALVAAAAAAVLVVGVLLGGPDGRQDVTRVELAAVARSTIGQDDLGPLTDPQRRADCLGTAGHPGARVLGGRQVRLDGVPGVLLVLPTGVLGRFRVLVVDEACRPLAQDVIG